MAEPHLCMHRLCLAVGMHAHIVPYRRISCGLTRNVVPSHLPLGVRYSQKMHPDAETEKHFQVPNTGWTKLLLPPIHPSINKLPLQLILTADILISSGTPDKEIKKTNIIVSPIFQADIKFMFSIRHSQKFTKLEYLSNSKMFYIHYICNP